MTVRHTHRQTMLIAKDRDNGVVVRGDRPEENPATISTLPAAGHASGGGGSDTQTTTGGSTSLDMFRDTDGNANMEMDMEAPNPGRYECVICGREMLKDETAEPFNVFSHADGSRDCTASCGTSPSHRAGVELAISKLTSLLERPDIDVEHTVNSDGENPVTIDIVSLGKVPVAVEVYYNCSAFRMKDRLEAIFDAGFQDVFIVMLEEGKFSPDSSESGVDNTTIGTFGVGRASYDDLTASLGTPLTSSSVDLSMFYPDSDMPKYLC